MSENDWCDELREHARACAWAPHVLSANLSSGIALAIVTGDWEPLCSRMADDFARLAEWCWRLDEMLVEHKDQMILRQPIGSAPGLACEQAMRAALPVLSQPVEAEALRGGERIATRGEGEHGRKWLREQTDVLLRTTDDLEWWSDVSARVRKKASECINPETLCDQIDRELANVLQNSADSADTPAQFLATSADVRDLAHLLAVEERKPRGEKRANIDVARAFVNGDDKKAQSLLRSLRRAKTARNKRGQ